MHIELTLSHLNDQKPQYLLVTCTLCKQETLKNCSVFSFCPILLQASNDTTDYAELLFPQRHLNPNTSLITNNFLPPTKSHPVTLEDTPPALPYRPNNPRNSAGLSPNSQLNRLYPSLEDEFSNTTTPVPDMVMMTAVTILDTVS